MATAADIERRLAETGLDGLWVEELEGRLLVSGMVQTDDERDRALAIARENVSSGTAVEDNIEVSGVVPATIEQVQDSAEDAGLDIRDRDLSEVESGAFEGATEGYEAQALEPGDFQSRDHGITSGWAASGPTSAIDDDVVSEGNDVFTPPSDPVVARDPVTLRTTVIGGLSESSMDDVGVERSASDGQYGDEAIADAIRRELLEDAATTDLDGIEVSVFEGIVTLRGEVPLLDDSDSAVEVASRVPGVRDVIDELEVRQLE
ncbi:MAG: BON domain-containing protein [Hyphomicrobiales bacterium]